MNSQVYDEASVWVVEFMTQEVNAHARSRFAKWLATSPEHVRAYLELGALVSNAEQLWKRKDIDVDALIAAARGESNVVAADWPGSEHGNSVGTTHHRRARSWTVALGVLGAAGAIAITFSVKHDPVYSTGIGEKHSYQLEDGSSIELGAASRARIRYSNATRSVELLAGQGLFRVAQDAKRPFSVKIGATQIRALGTAFDVNRKPSGTVVAVLEGRVAVEAGGSSEPNLPSTELTAGEALVVEAKVLTTRRIRADVIATTAWTRDQLAFDFAPLADVIEAFNRYNKRQLTIEGRGLSDFHVSGTFQASDPQTLPGFLKFLREQPGVVVTELGDRIVVASK